MKNLLFSNLPSLIFTVLCLIGCAGKHGKLMESALASYRANDYETALREAVMALKYKPDYEEAQNFAPTFFDAAVENRQDRIRSLASSSRRFKWDGIVAEYEALIEIIVKSENKFTFWKTRALFDKPCRRELRFPTLLLRVYQ